MDPIIVGGNGHSGTRVPVLLLRANGVNFGHQYFARRSRSDDTRLLWFYNRWAASYLDDKIGTFGSMQMKLELLAWLRAIIPFRRQRWGIKNPRSLLMLPFLATCFPDFYFVHIIRDGRDMTFGNVFARANRYVRFFVSQDERRLPEEVQMSLFWGRSNLFAQKFCLEHFPERYLMLRLEDFCDHPFLMTNKLFSFLDLPTIRADEIAGLISRPSSLGRWRSADPMSLSRIHDTAGWYLRHFGYPV